MTILDDYSCSSDKEHTSMGPIRLTGRTTQYKFLFILLHLSLLCVSLYLSFVLLRKVWFMIDALANDSDSQHVAKAYTENAAETQGASLTCIVQLLAHAHEIKEHMKLHAQLKNIFRNRRVNPFRIDMTKDTCKWKESEKSK